MASFRNAGTHRSPVTWAARIASVREAQLEDSGSGLAPVTHGWFVVNVRDAEWWFSERRAREVRLRERVRRSAGRVRPVRDQRHCLGAGADGPLPRRV